MSFESILTRADGVAVLILGSPVTYTPGVGSPISPRGIFDALHTRIDAGMPGVTSQGPAVFFRLADLPTDPETDTAATVTVNGTTYTIHTVEKDGKGNAVLLLHST